MRRRNWIVVCLVVLLVAGVALAAGAQGKKAEKKMDLGGERLGLIFNIWDLGGDAAYSDGLSTGLGLKYWLADKMALRALLEFGYANPGAGTTTTVFGLSGAFEYHFVKGRVSPYTGGLVGIEITAVTGNPTDLGLVLGALLGVEVRVLESLGLFAEYNLRLYLNEPVFNVDLATGNAGQIGVIVYLP
jgi:hypothetical protein